MKNKRLVLLILCLILLLSSITILLITKDKKEDLLAVQGSTLLLADTISKSFHNTEGLKSDLPLDKNVIDKYNQYIKDMKKTNDIEFNLSKRYGTPTVTEEDFIPTYDGFDADISDKRVENDIKMKKAIGIDLEYDKRIYDKKGEKYIKVKSLDYTKDDTVMLLYGKSYIAVPFSEVPKTYEYMSKSNDFIFVYNKQNTLVLDKYLRKVTYRYSSVTGSTGLIISITYDNKGIHDLEVSKPWEK